MEPISGGGTSTLSVKFAIDPSSACGVAANAVVDSSDTTTAVSKVMRFIDLSLPSYLPSAAGPFQYALRRLLIP